MLHEKLHNAWYLPDVQPERHAAGPTRQFLLGMATLQAPALVRALACESIDFYQDEDAAGILPWSLRDGALLRDG